MFGPEVVPAGVLDDEGPYLSIERLYRGIDK